MRAITAGLAIVLALSVGVACAELTPGQKQAAEALIKQFTAREFAIRENAVQKLVALGPDVLPLIRKTLAETKDNEVKLRCEMTLKGIVKKYDIVIEGDKVIATKFGASHVTIDVTDVPLKEVLNMLAEQSGNPPVEIFVAPDNKNVTLKVKNVPYWQAMDTLCRSASLAYIEGAGRRPDRVSTITGPAADLGAYPGPASVTMCLVKRRNYRIETRRFHAGRWSGETGVLQEQSILFHLEYNLEDRLSALRVLARITKVVTPDGVNHVSPLRGQEQFETMSRPYRQLGRNLVKSIKETRGELKGPVTIEGYVTFGFGVGKQDLRLKNIFGGGNPTVKNDKGLSLKLIRATREENGQTTVVFEVGYSAQDEQTRTHEQFGQRYGPALVDPKGNRHWKTRDRHISRRTPKTRVRLKFQNLPDVDGEWSIVFTRPTKIVKKTYPFKIENVPLP